MTTPQTDPARPLTIDLWSDLVCPFCLLGDAQLQAALAAERLAESAEIRVHAFELDPSAPAEPEDQAAHLMAKHGMSLKDVAANDERLAGVARDLALEFTSDRRVANTLLVHRAVQHASSQGKGMELLRALQRGYFAGTLDPFNAEVIVAEASGLGLDADAVRAALADPATEQGVRQDEAYAREIGVNGVPFTVLDERLAVSGAVGVDGFRDAIRQALALREQTNG